jgi:hypothetical protein
MDSSSSEVYRSHLLGRGSRQIRLLYIEPSRDRDAPLKCHVRRVSLNNPPYYATLSYCWGNRISGTLLNCEKSVFRISYSLDDALRCFRGLRQEVIWVDQICINQEDMAERSDQILLMNEIYAGAAECFVYLGEGTGERNDLHLLKEYVKSHRSDDDLEWRLREAMGEFADPVFEWRSSTWRKSFFNIVTQPYFLRIWVLQEIFFSKKITCMLGKDEFSWRMIEALAKDLPVMESLSATKGFKKRPVEQVWNAKVMEGVNLRTAEGDEGRAKALQQFMSFIELIDSLRKRRDNLYTLLVASRGFRATDPRDKIFALMNLADDDSQFPRPDYNWTVEDTYSKIAQGLIRQRRTVNMLSLTGLQVSTSFQMSWVPDWRQSPLFWNFQEKSSFKAGGARCRYAAEIKSDALLVLAHEIDSVTLVCPFVVDGPGITSKMAKLIKDAMKPILKEHLKGLTEPAELEESLVSLLFCDYSGGKPETAANEDLPGRNTNRVFAASSSQIGDLRDRNTDSLFTFFAPEIDDLIGLFSKRVIELRRPKRLVAMDLIEKTASLADKDKLAARIRTVRKEHLDLSPLESKVSEKVIQALQEKDVDYIKCLNTIDVSTRIIVTKEGRLGLAPSVTDVGDGVAVLKGARAPFILRRCGNRRFKIIGQAYIRGVMFGEALGSEEFKKFCLQNNTSLFKDVSIC